MFLDDKFYGRHTVIAHFNVAFINPIVHGLFMYFRFMVESKNYPP